VKALEEDFEVAVISEVLILQGLDRVIAWFVATRAHPEPAVA